MSRWVNVIFTPINGKIFKFCSYLNIQNYINIKYMNKKKSPDNYINQCKKIRYFDLLPYLLYIDAFFHGFFFFFLKLIFIYLDSCTVIEINIYFTSKPWPRQQYNIFHRHLNTQHSKLDLNIIMKQLPYKYLKIKFSKEKL